MVRRDRTDELRTLVAGNAAAPEAKPRGPAPNVDTQEFLRFAGMVNGNLAKASEMLSKLTQLVKQRNVFDDHSSEIADMTRTVQSQLEVVKGNMVTLDRLKQSAAGRWGGKKTESDKHTEAVVSSLQTHFKDVGMGFQEVLQERSESLKVTRDRRQQFTGTIDEAVLNAHDGTEDLQGMLQLHMPNSNLEYFNSRANDVRQVERSINELGDLFKEFARIVTEQEELVLRIDDDTTEALDNVNKGANELQRYLRNISSNRGLVIKIFVLLFFFIMFFGWFIV